MSDCYQKPLMSLKQGLAYLAEKILPLESEEKLPLKELDGRILSQPVHCPMNVPPANNSAMDGYAVSAKDCNAQSKLLCIGQSMAGAPFNGTLAQGQCVRIMTGALIPRGADSVVMQEQTETEQDTIQFLKTVKLGQNIRLAGEDLSQGDLLFEAGHRIRTPDIGLLASLGIASVSVKRRPRVALLSNGDELIEPGHHLGCGQIYESNRYALAAMLRRLPLQVDEFGIIPDKPEALRQAFTKASEYDAVISSGGVSVGDADYIKQILVELGDIDFWKLAIKPGKPFAYGRLGKAHYFGLPGNPVSAIVTCHQLAVPALRKLAGEQTNEPLKLQAVVSEAIRKRPGRLDFQRGIVQSKDSGILTVATTGQQGSGIMSSMSRANCYIVLEQERGSVEAGEKVDVILFDQLIG